MLHFRVELEISRTATVFAREGGKLHDLYVKWIDGGKSDEDFQDLSDFLDDEIDVSDLEFWVEDVRLIK